jgi:hypothetical protein
VPAVERSGLHRFVWGLLVVLTITAAYLYTFPQTNVFYASIVLLHAGAGVLATILFFVYVWKRWRNQPAEERLGWFLLTAGAAAGLVLIYTGTSRSHWNLLYLHIVLALVGLGMLIAAWWNRRAGTLPGVARIVVVLAVIAGLGAASSYLRNTRWQKRARIENPPLPPATMDGEGDGPSGPFFPSSAQVANAKKIPSKFFMESDSCQRCHADIYNQWYSSVHHFSSFNNQWYRKSIEYMQDVVGTRPSKWCGGCHDPAVLYSGMMDTPIRQIVHRPEAQAGLGCMMCHSIIKVKSTMGQGDFYLEYPKLHELAASKNPTVRRLHDFLVNLNPEPHRRVFLKPFMRDQTAEFCSSCHKVHLDVPVNHYRWIRGFNEYDNWQASGVSGQGARSFYYPAKSSQCADCHMPLEHSTDAGNIGGFVHSHRFPAANTAIPVANEDSAQLQLTEDFLKKDIVSVDIFALSPAGRTSSSSGQVSSDLATTFAVGEEAESNLPKGATDVTLPVTAPLNRVQPGVRAGDTVRVDVVVRTKKVGHFFPGGTVDAYDTWLELKATDDRGRPVFWSGRVEDGGKGPVEKGAHFYRSLSVDAHGNPINKRNAWATRALVYVHLIPPGAADTVHYRLHIPENSGNKITLHARLCYRKFAWWHTQFAFAGVPAAQQPNLGKSNLPRSVKGGLETSAQETPNSSAKSDNSAKPARMTPDYDDTAYDVSGPVRDVSAKQQRVPDLPIVVLAENEVVLGVSPKKAPAPQAKVVLQADDWQRWNDYGIGLFLQGDLKGAEAAFEKITEFDPKTPDGLVNIGRAAVEEGEMERARRVMEKALALAPKLARAHFFYAKVLRNDGK